MAQEEQILPTAPSGRAVLTPLPREHCLWGFALPLTTIILYSTTPSTINPASWVAENIGLFSQRSPLTDQISSRKFSTRFGTH